MSLSLTTLLYLSLKTSLYYDDTTTIEPLFSLITHLSPDFYPHPLEPLKHSRPLTYIEAPIEEFLQIFIDLGKKIPKLKKKKIPKTYKQKVIYHKSFYQNSA